jgi:hypothetical protein
MIISHSKRFVLLSPWKAASQTTQARLAAFQESTYEPFYHFNPVLNRVVHQHLTCAEFSCLPEADRGYRIASFIRNPYDRAYSGFLQVRRDVENQPLRDYPAPWIKELVVRQVEENRRQLERARYDFDDWIALLKEEQVRNLGGNSSLPLHPGHYWTHLGRHPFVEFVARVERFEEDFQRLVAWLGIEAERIAVANCNQSGLPGAGSHGYRHLHRMHARSIAKINTLFADDFELLGYERCTAGGMP